MAINKLQKKWSGSILDLCAFSTGFIAVVFLLMLTREVVAYYGSQEVLFGVVPAFCLGAMAYGIRYIKKYIEKDTVSLLVVSYMASIPFLLFSIIMTRLLPFLVQLPAGVDLPFYWAIAGIVLTAIPTNIILGAQISLVNHLYIGKNKKDYPVKVAQGFTYALIGAVSGAVLYTLIGAYLLTAFNVLVFLTLLTWCCLAALVGVLIPAEDLQHRKFWGTLALLALFLFTLLLFSPVSGSLEKSTLKKAWRNTQLMRTLNTSHGKLSFTLAKHELTVYNNRTRIFATSENARAEENAHVPALALAYPPRNMLMIGGGLGGTLEELLKYASLETMDYCEFDRKVLSHSRDYLLQYNYFRDKRVQLRAQDGRSFLRKTPARYDLILVKASPLASLMNNRFASSEFFAIARERLSTAGIMVLTIETDKAVSAHRVPAGALPIVNSFKQEFPNAVIIPGIDLYCVGSAASTDSLAYLDGYTFANRLIERGIRAGYLTSETMPILFPSDKIGAAQRSFTMDSLNSDMNPKGFGSALYAWICPIAPVLPMIAQRTATTLTFVIILVLLFLILVKGYKKPANEKDKLIYRMQGVSLGGLMMFTLFLFQTLTGMAYIGIALLAAALSTGMLCGHLRTEKAIQTNKINNRIVLTVILSYVLVLGFWLFIIVHQEPLASPLTYVMLILVITACAGYPLGRSASIFLTNASEQLKSQAPGILVSDHYREVFCGAASAVALMSLVLIPLIGFPGALALLCVSVLVTVLISYS